MSAVALFKGGDVKVLREIFVRRQHVDLRPGPWVQKWRDDLVQLPQNDARGENVGPGQALRVVVGHHLVHRFDQLKLRARGSTDKSSRRTSQFQRWSIRQHFI
eukprot:6195499-Pleurochrysis_carterae.AAC.2